MTVLLARNDQKNTWYSSSEGGPHLIACICKRCCCLDQRTTPQLTSWLGIPNALIINRLTMPVSLVIAHSARGAKHLKLSRTQMALALSHSMQSTSHAKGVPMPMIMTAWHSEECVTILRRKSISLFWNAESNVVKMAMRSGCHWIQGSSLQLVVAATEDPLHSGNTHYKLSEYFNSIITWCLLAFSVVQF